MNARFPSIIVLGLIVTVLCMVMSTWLFLVIVTIGGAALAVVVWKLVAAGHFTPPTVLIDEARERIKGRSRPKIPPEEIVPAPIDRTPQP